MVKYISRNALAYTTNSFVVLYKLFYPPEQLLSGPLAV